MNNEFPIAIGDNEFILKPTWGVLSNIENALDTSVTKLISRIGEGEVRLTELVHIIHIATKGQDNAPSIKTIGEYIAEDGMPDSMMAVGRFLSCAFVGSKEYEEGGEEKN